MKKEIEEYVTNMYDPIFVKDKIVCIFICAYIYLYMQRKRCEMIYAKLFTLITFGKSEWRGVGLCGSMYTGWALCFYFCII
jgi:hypothetical protein